MNAGPRKCDQRTRSRRTRSPVFTSISNKVNTFPLPAPSGCGKSTLLSILGFIFQSFNLIGDLNVYENVELPLTYRGMSSSEKSTLLHILTITPGPGVRSVQFNASGAVTGVDARYLGFKQPISNLVKGQVNDALAATFGPGRGVTSDVVQSLLDTARNNPTGLCLNVTVSPVRKR
jgi:energy-coupling factor transporter ATP-binding protein EcfA2